MQEYRYPRPDPLTGVPSGLAKGESTDPARRFAQAMADRARVLRKPLSGQTPAPNDGVEVRGEKETAESELRRLRRERLFLQERQRLAKERSDRLEQLLGRLLGRLEQLGSLLADQPPRSDPNPESQGDPLERIQERCHATMEMVWRKLGDDSEFQHRLMTQGIQSLGTDQPQLPLPDSGQQRVEELTQALRQAEEKQALLTAEMERLQSHLQDYKDKYAHLKESNVKHKEQLRVLRGAVDRDPYDQLTDPRSTPGGAWTWIRGAAGALAGGLVLAALGYWGYGAVQTPRPAGSIAARQLAPPRPAPAETQTPAMTDSVQALTPAAVLAVPVVAQTAPPAASGAQMMRVEGGSFRMGTNLYGLPDIEHPARQISVQTFDLARFEVTFDEYDAFAKATQRRLPEDQGWGRGRRPVINVTWSEAQSYVDWLSRQTGQAYRLPREAEWEYALAGGSKALYWWGERLLPKKEVCFTCETLWDDQSTAPVGSATANPFGLYDMGGNVMEWVADCATEGGTCANRVVRGGAFNKPGDTLRITARRFLAAETRLPSLGFRIARGP